QGSVLPGDIFVICSDGLTGHVADRDILMAAGTAAPRGACDALLGLTLERGASDNVTVVVIRCGDRTDTTAAAIGDADITVVLTAQPATGGA
ncbi:MAG: hypothetical protein INR70_30870, partial [Parafilimonas terrae]|nr:hypothetical protein [Parafilimonas terrae]